MFRDSTGAPRAALGFEAARRRSALYVRALWGQPFECVAGAAEAGAPSIRQGAILLPEQWVVSEGARSITRYRAAAVHAAAHLIYGGVVRGEGLKPRQRALIELLEDARVESLALSDFPGLRRLWLGFHLAAPDDGRGFDALLARLARAILDPQYRDPDTWIEKGLALYRTAVHRCPDPESSRRVGLQLANDLGQLRIPMNEADSRPVAAYRDDNLHLWWQEPRIATDGEARPSLESASANSAHLAERREGRSAIFAAEQPSLGAPPGWAIRRVTDAAALDYSEPDPASASAPCLYPEWNRSAGLYRPGWASLREYPAELGPADEADAVLAQHARLTAALMPVVRMLRYRGQARLRRQYDGEEIDLDAAVDSFVEARGGALPALRAYQHRQLHGPQDVALLVLLDLSESANHLCAPAGPSRLELTRAASLVLAEVLRRLGLRHAIHGFHSDGRHDVRYMRFKDFHEDWDRIARQRLSGMRARLSTRLGIALRHAGSALSGQPGDRRLLLVITDGEPSDIDVHDGRYLTEDARAAVRELRAKGVLSFCLSLAADSSAHTARIFGVGRYAELDRAERLPEVLPRLVLTLTRQH